MTMPVSKRSQGGSILLEGLFAILIFSMGILALVALLGASVKNSTDAKYRSEASLLANQVIGEMWTGDKSNAMLVANYEAGARFDAWKARVEQTLPGVSDDANLPTIDVDANNVVTVTVRWQAPGETTPHNFVAIARINA